MELKVILLLLISVSILKFSESLECDDSHTTNTEHKLRVQLFCNYDKSQRPVKNHKNSTINVRLRYIVKSFDYSEHSQTLTINSWMSMSWNDEHLTWNPSDYDGITTIHNNMDEIWTPDIYLYNSDISSGLGSCHSVDCLISSEGKVVCIIPCSHTGHCNGDFTNWPFDRQNCSYTFGSWMKSGEELNYDAAKSTVKSKDAAKHSQWKMIATFFRKNDGKFSSLPNQTFPSLSYAFLIERHSGFHVAGTFVPALVLAIVNLSLAWLNSDGYERFVLVGLNLFSHYIYLEQMFFYIPYNGDSVPRILLFFRDSLFITGFLLCVTIVLKILNKYNEKPAAGIEVVTNLFTSKLIFGDTIFSVRQTHDKLDAEQDVASLVETFNTSSFSKDNLVWRTFANILDKLIFVILFITYTFMFITLLPNSYDDNSWAEIAVETSL